jgi:hypothetical protein
LNALGEAGNMVKSFMLAHEDAICTMQDNLKTRLQEIEAKP